MSRLDLLAIGEPMVEFNQTRPGDPHFLQGFGGDTSNMIIAAARSGARAGYVTRVGDDEFGRLFLDLWRAEGVDTRGVAIDPRAHTGVYFGGAPAGLVAFLLCWLLASCFDVGNPWPLPYLPVVNPLELTQGFALISAVMWALRAKHHDVPIVGGWKPSRIPMLLGVSIFTVANAVVARAVHHLAGVPYTLPALVGSALFEAAIAILWGVTALAVMSYASRRGVRQLWFAGAALLGLLIVKLFLIDLSGTGTVGRIVSFLATGGLMLLIGYISPIPPRAEAVRS